MRMVWLDTIATYAAETLCLTREEEQREQEEPSSSSSGNRRSILSLLKSQVIFIFSLRAEQPFFLELTGIYLFIY